MEQMSHLLGKVGNSLENFASERSFHVLYIYTHKYMYSHELSLCVASDAF